MNITQFEAKLREFDALRESDAIKQGSLENIQPLYAEEWPQQLHPSVRSALAATGIEQPYQHQVDAIIRSLHGIDVAMESPTASGKTLAFAAPMLDSLVREPDSHALMIYPMKALAFDQREQIRHLCAPLSIESWTYDGDTPEGEKKVLREQPPHILLTNPEYLNTSFLGWRELWPRFLSNLRYVIVDEMHEYRGFFGGNMALLLRRFFLYMDKIGAKPRLFFSTATCANPAEHANNLTGRDVEVVSARGVIRPLRHFMFVNPDIPDFRYRERLQLRVEQAALAALSEGLRVLVFCPTKRFLEEAFRNCRRKAEERGLDPDRVSPFHADLKAEDRLTIQQSIRTGDIRIVFTTNALELGLDIGGLDGVILAGFPSSVMSAWQQIGRAGRGWDRDAFVLFYAMNDPIDRFFVGNLPAFLDKPFDELVVDPDNEQLIENHLPSLVEETGGLLRPKDESILGTAFYAAGKEGGKPAKGYKPQHRLDLRGGFGQSFKLRHGNENIGQISALRRFREAYIGAIFTFFGHKYRVHSHEEHSVVLEEGDQNLRTDARFYTVLSIKDIIDGSRYGDIDVHYGILDVFMNFTGYKIVDDRSGEERGAGGVSDAHVLKNLRAFWIVPPPGESTTPGMGALEHMLRVGAMFVIPADRFDTSTYSKVGDEPTAFYYENYSGGIGVAKKLFGVWQEALKKGIEVASDCSCRSGCQNCIEPAKSYNISNAAIDKVRGIELATELLAKTANGPDHTFRNGRMVPL